MKATPLVQPAKAVTWEHPFKRVRHWQHDSHWQSTHYCTLPFLLQKEQGQLTYLQHQASGVATQPSLISNIQTLAGHIAITKSPSC